MSKYDAVSQGAGKTVSKHGDSVHRGKVLCGQLGDRGTPEVKRAHRHLQAEGRGTEAPWAERAGQARGLLRVSPRSPNPADSNSEDPEFCDQR